MAVLIPAKVAKEIRKDVPQEEWKSLRERLERIARDPHGSHSDVKPFEDGYRVRHGVWRAIYVVNGNGDIEVVKAGHRRRIYR